MEGTRIVASSRGRFYPFETILSAGIFVLDRLVTGFEIHYPVQTLRRNGRMKIVNLVRGAAGPLKTVSHVCANMPGRAWRAAQYLPSI